MKTKLNWKFKQYVDGYYPYKKCSRLETTTMDFSNLTSRDNWTFHHSENIMHFSHKRNNTNKSNFPGDPGAKVLDQTPTEEMDFAVRYSLHLPARPHPTGLTLIGA